MVRWGCDPGALRRNFDVGAPGALPCYSLCLVPFLPPSSDTGFCQKPPEVLKDLTRHGSSYIRSSTQNYEIGPSSREGL